MRGSRRRCCGFKTRRPKRLRNRPASPGSSSGSQNAFVLALFFLLIVPFPLSVIPGADRWVGLITAGQRAAVVWVGRTVFGLSLTIFPGGSGDTTYNYVELFLYAGLALVVRLDRNADGPRPAGVGARDAIHARLRALFPGRDPAFLWLEQAHPPPVRVRRPGIDDPHLRRVLADGPALEVHGREHGVSGLLRPRRAFRWSAPPRAADHAARSDPRSGGPDEHHPSQLLLRRARQDLLRHIALHESCF